MLECHGGCTCRGIHSRWLRSNLPFPRLETSMATLRQQRAAVGNYAAVSVLWISTRELSQKPCQS